MCAVGIVLTSTCGVFYLSSSGIVPLIAAWPSDPMRQQHYFSVLPVLLIQYYLDHFRFLRIDGIITPLHGVMNQPAATLKPVPRRIQCPISAGNFKQGLPSSLL